MIKCPGVVCSHESLACALIPLVGNDRAPSKPLDPGFSQVVASYQSALPGGGLMGVVLWLHIPGTPLSLQSQFGIQVGGFCMSCVCVCDFKISIHFHFHCHCHCHCHLITNCWLSFAAHAAISTTDLNTTKTPRPRDPPRDPSLIYSTLLQSGGRSVSATIINLKLNFPVTASYRRKLSGRLSPSR